MRLHPPIQLSEPARGVFWAIVLQAAAVALVCALAAAFVWFVAGRAGAHTPSGSASCAGISARMSNAPDAWNAARDAARDAAWAAAGDALRPTVEALQASALDLLDRMIDPSKITEGDQ